MHFTFLGLQDGWRTMDTRKPSKVQPPGRGFTVHRSSIPEGMDSDLHSLRQCWDVEHKVRDMGKTIFRATILSPSLHFLYFVPR